MEENEEIWRENWEQIKNYREVELEPVRLAWFD
jgi:hypothetical protein